MTVCIAMLYNSGREVAVASDRMTTGGLPPMEFEHKGKKIQQLNKKCVMLSAGSALMPRSICHSSKKRIEEKKVSSIEGIANIVKDVYHEKRLTQAEERYLKTRDLTIDKFYGEYINKLPEGLVMALDDSIANENIEVDILIAGVDDEGSHIHAVFHPGRSNCIDALGYASVGSGAYHAIGVITTEYDPECDREAALRLIFKAKKVSEIAPGVGKMTDISLINKKGITHLTDEEVKQISLDN